MSKRICAWCGEPLGNGNGAENTETHGICSKCLTTYFSNNIVHILNNTITQKNNLLFQEKSVQPSLKTG